MFLMAGSIAHRILGEYWRARRTPGIFFFLPFTIRVLVFGPLTKQFGVPSRSV